MIDLLDHALGFENRIIRDVYSGDIVRSVFQLGEVRLPASSLTRCQPLA